MGTTANFDIPFLDGTELVRDYPQFSEDLAEAIDDGLLAAGNAGIGSNVVQTVKTDVFSTNATSPTNVTGLSVTITPSSATSKILIIADLSVGQSSNNFRGTFFRIDGGNALTYIGDAAGSRTRAMFGHVVPAVTTSKGSGSFLDSPATASPVTYTVQAWSSDSDSSAHINFAGDDSNNTRRGRNASSLIAIEVAA